MSPTSIEGPAFPRDRDEDAGRYGPSDGCAATSEPGLLEMLSLSDWRKLTLETLVLLALITVLQHWVFRSTEISGMPHPYWLSVLLASSQYGVSGGLFAAAAASIVYVFGIPPQSATQDFYAYARIVAGQPAAWLGTALVLGGLRSLHIYQTAELTDRLAACRRLASDFAAGLERATAEISALERRIAVDVSSVAALSRSFSKIDLSDRWAAAASFGELFRVGAGATAFTIYLRNPDGYVPVLTVEDNVTRSVGSIKPLQPSIVDAMMNESVRREAGGGNETSDLSSGHHVVLIRSDASIEPLAAIVCETLHPSQDVRRFRARVDELSRAFATILSMCPNRSRARQ